MSRNMQNSTVSTSIMGMKKRVTLRRGAWIMALLRGTAFPGRPFGAGRPGKAVPRGDTVQFPSARFLMLPACPGLALAYTAAQRRDQVAAQQDHPGRKDIDECHEQTAAGGSDGRGIQANDLTRLHM